MTQDQDKIETGEVTELAPMAAGKSLDELLREREQLDAHITRLQRAARADDLAAARELVRRHGFTASELRCPAPVGAVEAIPSAAVAEADKPTRKVAAKYRNPETGNTWTGRGIRPKWIEAALAAGKSLDDLLIPADGPATEAQAEAETEAA